MQEVTQRWIAKGYAFPIEKVRGYCKDRVGQLVQLVRFPKVNDDVRQAQANFSGQLVRGFAILAIVMDEDFKGIGHRCLYQRQRSTAHPLGV